MMFLVIEYTLIALCKFCYNDDVHTVMAIGLYLFTCFNYGCLASVIPELSYQIFGPAETVGQSNSAPSLELSKRIVHF